MSKRWYDLAQPFYEGMPHAQTQLPPKISRIMEIGQHPINVTQFTFVTHIGTHVDAPLHFIPGGKSIDQLPFEAFIGEGVILDLPKPEFGLITADDLRTARPEVRPGDIVFIRTGWGVKYAAEDYYRHPYMLASAAEWLIERRVKMLGVDTITPDLAGLLRGPDFKYVVHPLLLGAGILIVEHLNLEAVAGKRGFIMAAPIVIKGADGAPARVAALVED